MKKIALVNPPSQMKGKYVREGRCNEKAEAFAFVLPPLSLLSIASVLKANGFDVKIFDFEIEKEKTKKIIAEIEKFNPDLILVNTGVETIYTDLAFSEFLRKKTGAFLGVFGLLPSVEDLWILKNYKIDFIIRNEPEITALEVSKIKESDFFNKIKRIKGVSFSKNGRFFRNKKRVFCKNLNRIKVTTYDLIDIKKYKLPFSERPVGLVAPERGCPFNCIFCATHIYYGNIPRYKSIENTIEEIKSLVYDFGVKDIGFWSEILTLNKMYTKKLFNKIIEEKIDARFYLTTRVDTVDREILSLMKRAGVITVAFGIESACQKILDLSKKGIRVSQTRKTIKNIKSLGMNALGHVIFGLPGETKNSMKKTLEFVIKQNVDFVNFYIAVPYPGTPFFKIAKRNGWITTYDWSRYGLQNAVISYPWLSSKMLKKFREHAFLKFYTTPKKMIKVLKTIGISDMVTFMKRVGKVYFDWIKG